MLAGAGRVGQLRQPALEASRDLGGQGLEREPPPASLGVVPFRQLGVELQEPGQAVGTLEADTALAPQIFQLSTHPLGCKALLQGRPGLGDVGRLRIQTAQAHEQPVPVDS